MNRTAAVAMLTRIQEALTTQGIAWGAAINAAEKAAPGPAKESLQRIAQLQGLEMARLCAGIAAKVSP